MDRVQTEVLVDSNPERNAMFDLLFDILHLGSSSLVVYVGGNYLAGAGFDSDLTLSFFVNFWSLDSFRFFPSGATHQLAEFSQFVVHRELETLLPLTFLPEKGFEYFFLWELRGTRLKF